MKKKLALMFPTSCIVLINAGPTFWARYREPECD